ncbi:glycerate kinase [Solimonas marina]|uniref:Glycerate kinase n=1 Tax=Solimonas marina TaxID=2714601 RepID=A0A970BAC3_9GAMM|nr:glycerate kinase [Solimonas marina]NKF23226.1 glycerate kinase [Solimonas marina]
MKTIVIAPDSFKESLSARGVAEAIRDGLAQVWPDAEYRLRPMADGGEGTVAVVLDAGIGAQPRTARVHGPLGGDVDAQWAWLPQARLAILDMAAASGLMLVDADRRDAGLACSHGTGELMRAALDAGAQRIIIGIGGSATNDGGAGLLRALGVQLRDAAARPLPPGGRALQALASIDLTQLDPRLAHVHVEVAADVRNPLCGPDGASHIFGPQKGADAAQVQQLDAALWHFADLCAQTLGRDERDSIGAGAAGGVGFALKAFFGATFRPGVDVVAELVGLDDALRDADLVITGEGRVDRQTLNGKTPFGVARHAARHHAPVLVLAGSLGDGYEALYEHGISAAFSLVPRPMPLSDALSGAAPLLRERARDIARLWQAAASAPS